MNQLPGDRLYKLIPAIYQIRDVEEGEPLRALLAVIEQELGIIEDDINNLYDNWFIETCDDWVVPYIGDLLDVRELESNSFSTNQPQSARSRPYGQQEQRAYVANTLAYRRRKGTAPILEQLVRDVTGWRARTVEFSRLLLSTQNLNHIRSASATVDLRANSLQLVGTPFEQQAVYTAEVRRASQGGRYNVPNIGLFIWRLQSYPIKRSTARVAPFRLDNEPTGRFYTFNPLGYDDVPLFNQPQKETDIVTLAQEINLPAALRYEPLANELKQRRQLCLQGKSIEGIRYFDSDQVIQIFVNGQPNPIPPEEILICSLLEIQENQQEESQPWRFVEVDSELSLDDTALPTKTVAVDPELGRIAFLDRILPQRVEVSYLYAFSDDLGGGSYSRGVTKNDLLDVPTQDQTQVDIESLINPLLWEVEQAISAEQNPLATAVQAWNQTVSAWQSLQDGTHIHLASITVHLVREIKPGKKLQRFAPGIVNKGLDVVPGWCNTEICVTPGLAIDSQGRCLQIRVNETVDLSEIDLSSYPNGTGLLVISYRAALQENNYQLDVVPETAIDDTGYPQGTFIPLAKLVHSRHGIELDKSVRYSFQAGIVQGLEFKVRPGTLEAVITAGTAIDHQGRQVVAATATYINLKSCQGLSGWLAVSKNTQDSRAIGFIKNIRDGQRWPLSFISAANAKINQYIYLAHLNVPQVKVSVESVADIHGLDVIAQGNKITVTAGSVKNTKGEEIKLERNYQFDLSAYAARQLVLFISSQKRQGFPIKPVSHDDNQDWQQLGIVSEIPNQSDTGIILINDNFRYTGDLEIVIPQARRLKIVAADGWRSHIQGNVFVQGTAPGDQLNQGELLLDGLLIEGQVIVLPGNLERLEINDSTLVPEQGGLQIQSAQELDSWKSSNSDQEDGFGLIPIAIVMLTFIQEWLRPKTGAIRPPEEFLRQLTQLLMQQINQLRTEIWQTLVPNGYLNDWHCLSEVQPSSQTTAQQDNSRLEISLNRSICGSLVDFTGTISHLKIEACIIDKGQPRNNIAETSGVAISFPSAASEIFNTTVLGMTTVSQIEASNSLFTEKVTVAQNQIGCIRFSHIPEGSRTPSRYQCQPDLAFQEALNPLPEAIASVAIAYGKAQPIVPQNQQLFIGTAGRGVFRSQNNGATWQAVNQGLTNPYVATVLAYTQDGIGEVFLTGTTGGKIFRSLNSGNNWTSLDAAGTNATITVLRQYDWTLTGNLVEQGQIQINRLLCPAECRIGDTIAVENQTQDRQSREIIAINIDESAEITTLILNAPFDNLSGIINFFVNTLLAATAGDGIIRGNSNAENWISINTGLTNRDVRTLEVYFDGSKGQLVAGTAGGGVFQIIHNESEDKYGDRWIPINKGLKNYYITALILDADEIIIGTSGGGIFYFNDSEGWIAINQGLNSLDITALVSYQITGTVSIEGTAVTGVKTFFEEEGLQAGDVIAIAGETGKIRSIDSNTQLIIEPTLPSDLTGVKNYNPIYNLLLAATSDGKIFRSINGGNWTQLSLDLKGLDITALTVNTSNENLFAGTAAGSMLRSENAGDSWLAINEKLTNVVEKLQIMERLQPLFTSKNYGDPGYAQLRQNCASEIRTGSDDKAEMGAFNALKQPQRETNLQANLEEYLRFGLEAGIFYVT